MSATRTQVYFTEEQRRRLDAVARRDGKTLAQVVRDAVDAYLDGEPDGAAVNESLSAMLGARPEVAAPDRSKWDRRNGQHTG